MDRPAPVNPLLRRPLAAYFLLTYLITWAILLPLALSLRGDVPFRLAPEFHALGALGPLTAAYLVSRGSGEAALREWTQAFTRWRAGSLWWLLAVAGPFALFVVSALAARLGGASWPDFGQLAAPRYGNAAWLFDLLFVGTFAYGLGEEPGWRAFALPRLERRHGPLVATLVLTPFWALFHWPAFLYRDAYQGGVPTVVGFLFGLLAGAIVLTWLWDGSRGSLPLVIVFHGLINIVMQVASVVSQPVVAVMNGILALGAVGIAAWWIARARRTPAPTRAASPAAEPPVAAGRN